MSALARVVIARARTVLVIAAGLMLLCGLLGAGSADKVSAAGFTDPGSESAQVDRLVRDHFGPQNPDVVVRYTAPDGQTLDDIGPLVQQQLARIDPALLQRPIETYWNSAPGRRQFLRSADNRQALAVVFLAGDDNRRIAAYPDIEAGLRVAGVPAKLSGYSALATEINGRSQRDLVLAESVSLPLTATQLVVMFGGLIAASFPVAVGVLAVLGAMGAIQGLAEITEVSTFAVNIASLLGLGMAIDYPEISSWQIIPVQVISGIGFGMVVAPSLDMLLGQVPAHEAGAASGLLNTAQQLGIAFGIALVGVVFFTQLDHTSSHGAELSVPQVRAELAALGVPADAQDQIVAGFRACVHDRSIALDPSVLPDSCRSAGMDRRVTVALSEAGAHANAENFSNSFSYTLRYGVGILLIVCLGLLALPRHARMANPLIDDDSGRTRLPCHRRHPRRGGHRAARHR